MLKELSLKEFIAALASDSPAPGGGSASALSGAQAAALVAMYCRLSLDPLKYDAAAELKRWAEQADACAAHLVEAVDRDSKAFHKVMAAFRLPKRSAAEKERRAAALREAFAGAAAVPLQAARHCLELLELAARAAGKGNPAAVTDLGVGNLLAWAALQGACYNVRVNLASLRGGAAREKLARETEALLERGAQLYAKNREFIEIQLGTVLA